MAFIEGIQDSELPPPHAKKKKIQVKPYNIFLKEETFLLLIFFLQNPISVCVLFFLVS